MPARLSFDGPLAIVTIDRPESLNALNRGLIEQIGDAIDKVSVSNARALVFVGSGEKAFCAGADVDGLLNNDARAMREGIAFGQATFAKLDRLHIPSIAVLHGYALGGGLELAMACTFRVATRDAKMGLPEIKLGLLPGYGGTQRLPRLVGEARAVELVMSGRIVNAGEARVIGLIHDIADGTDLIDIARNFANRFICFSQRALEFAHQAVQRALTVPLSEGLKIEADLVSLAFQTNDAKEGMTAFLEKRTPSFTDS